jgi:thiol-disulfide isomerase/thioredoxin
MVKSGKKMQFVSHATSNPMLKYVMIGLLAVLLIFAAIYIINVQKQAEHFDGGVYKVVYIYSNSCGHCKSFSPTFSAYAASQVSNTKLKVLSYEKDDAHAKEYLATVTAFPTVLIVDPSGTVVKTQTGNVSIEVLKTFVNSVVA